MGFLKQDLQNKNLVVLDIGSQFLKALLLETNKEKKGIIHCWSKEVILKNNNGGTSIDIENILKPCQKVLQKLKNKIPLKTNQLFLGVGSEIIGGVSTSFCYKRENPEQKIDITELKHLVQRVQWKGFEKIRKQFVLDTNLLEKDLKLIDAHIVDIKVDGQSISNPLGFQGRELCLTIFNSYAEKALIKDLINLFSKLGLEIVGVAPHPYSLFYSFGSNLSKKDVLIIDVGGKVTEITLIKNQGEIIEARSFHLGGQSFTKTLAEFLELDLNDAETIKMQYSRGGVSPMARRRLEKLISSNVSSWLGGVKVVLNEFFEKHNSFPKQIFLCGGGGDLPEIKKALESMDGVEVITILPHEISKAENKTKLQNIPFLALSNLALERSKNNLFSSTLKRAIRLIE